MQDLLRAGKNTGVIIDEPKETDLYFGSNDVVQHILTLASREWLIYYSKGELQIGVYYDTMGCVSFSALNIVEAILNYQIEHRLMSAENILWLQENGYIGEDGKVKLSNRFTVAMSGTTSSGNSGSNVWSSIRHDGVVPEELCPWDSSRNAPMDERTATWYRDKANVTALAIDMGQQFVERFDIFYERIATTPDAMRAGLLHSPVQVFISTGCAVIDTIQQACDKSINHAVSLCDDDDPRTYWPAFDHYINQDQESGQERYIRRLASDYTFYPTGYVCTINEKNVEDMSNNFVKIVKDEDSSAVGFFIPAHSPETLKNLGEVYGKKIVEKENGEVDFEAIIEGTIKLNQ